MSVRVLAVAVAACLCAAGALLSPAGASHQDDPPRLDAVVGTDDGFNIALNDASGNLVTRLAPGTYTIVVHDRSALHNFHLASTTLSRSPPKGPGRPRGGQRAPGRAT